MYIVTRNDVVVKSTIVKVRLLLGYSDFPGNLVMNGRESRVQMEVSTKQEKKREECTTRKKKAERGHKNGSFPRPGTYPFT